MSPNGRFPLPTTPVDSPKGPNMFRKLILATVLVGFALSASACRTVKGAGQDIQSVGEAGSDAIGNK